MTHYHIAPIMHPAALIRGRWAMEPPQVATLRKGRRLALGEEPLWTEAKLRTHMAAKAINFPSLGQVLAWAKEVGSQALTLSCDIECAGPHLVRIGFCRFDTLEVFGIPFRLKGGQLYWRPEDLPLVVEALDSVLDHPEVLKWFHNGQAFDVPYLQHLGFKVSAFAGDTLLLQRFMFPEQPASLQFCASLYANFPHWKHLANPDDEENDK